MNVKINRTKLSLALSTVLLISLGSTVNAGVSGGEPIFYDGTNTDLLIQYNPNVPGSLIPMKDGEAITKDNLVIMDFNPNEPGMTVPSYVYGGYVIATGDASVINTSVEVLNGKVKNDVIGAAVGFETQFDGPFPIIVQTEGSVYIKGGDLGGISGAEIKAGGTKIELTGSTLSAIGSVVVDGGNIGYSLSGASIMNQAKAAGKAKIDGRVIINDGTFESFVYGAFGLENNVETTGYLEINGGVLHRNTYATKVDDSHIINMNGEVKLTDGHLLGNLYATFSNSRTREEAIAEGKIDITGGTVDGGVYAGYARVGRDAAFTETVSKAKGVITMDNGLVKGVFRPALASAMKEVEVSGGLIFTGGEFQGETIHLASGAIEILPWDEPYGSVSAENSYLSIGMGAELTNPNLEIFGGYIKGGVAIKNAFTNNIFDFHGKPLKVDNLGNFSNYNLYLNDANSQLVNTDSALITVTKNLHSEDTWTIDEATGDRVVTVNKPTILLKGISGEKRVVGGEYVHLLSLADGAKITTGDYAITDGELTEVANLSDFFELGETHELQVGLASKVEVEYEIDDENQYVTARFVTPKEIDEELVEAKVQPMVADRLAALMNITRKHGLQDPAMRDLVHGKVTPFVLMQGGRDRYQLDSHITADTFDALIGAGYKQNSLSIAGYISYGYDDYKSYNNTALGQVKGKGHNSSYGVGFSGIYEFNEALYADFGAQVGRIKTTYSSNDILTGGGTFANYNSKSTYFSGYVGGGYVYPLNETSRLDTSLRYMYSHIGSDTVTIDGDTIDFGGLTSSIAEIKTRYELDVTDESTFNASLGYQYEFDAKGDARIAGIAVNAPGLKGSTGVVGIGYEYHPYSENEDSFLNRSKINIDAQGYFGKRRGGNIAITYRYMFD